MAAKLKKKTCGEFCVHIERYIECQVCRDG